MFRLTCLLFCLMSLSFAFSWIFGFDRTGEGGGGGGSVRDLRLNILSEGELDTPLDGAFSNQG